MKLVVVSGLSGAGKSVAMHALEDLDYYCIDNLPVALFAAFIEEINRSDYPGYERAAVAIDSRNPVTSLEGFAEMIVELRDKGVVDSLVFLQADDQSLVKRFSETRRKHPLSTDRLALSEAIAKERIVLEDLNRNADVTIDSSHTNLHQLRDLILHRVHRHEANTVSLLLQSFGFKHGMVHDADMLFDVRCLPNPYWVPRLRGLTGHDAAVQEYLATQPTVNEMVDSIAGFLGKWIPEFESENRSYLTVAVGCTGGKHRSVYVAEQLAEHFRGQRDAVLVRHRDSH